MRILIDGQTLATPEVGRGIGRVFIELVSALARYDISHEWVLAMPAGADLDVFADDVLRVLKLETIQLPPAGDWGERTRLYGERVSELARRVGADWYWNPNPLMMNVALPAELPGLKVALTVHDLIPALLPHIYLDNWAAADREEYLRRVESLKTWPDYLPCVSAGAVAQVRDYCGEPRGRLDAASNAVDFRRFWPIAGRITRKDRPGHILTVSGDDPRKGLPQVVEGFCLAAAAGDLGDLTFKVVCGVSEQTRARLTAIAAEHGLSDRVEILGFVTDAQVAHLTRTAYGVVFDSLLEGFGLPLLEALACGAPVAAADIPTSREVCGDYAVYFKPNDAKGVAQALKTMVAETEAGRFDHQGAVRHARGFEWMNSAALYSRGFHPQPPAIEANKARKIALLTPWPPQASSVANDAYHLAMELRERCVLTVVHTDDVLDPTPLEGVEIIPMAKFLRRKKSFDGAVVQIGNNTPFHKQFYQYAIEHPSTIIIHDPNIHPFVLDAFGRSSKPGERAVYLEALGKYVTPEVLSHADSTDFTGVDVFEHPLNALVAERSHRVVLHSRAAAEALRGVVPNVPIDTYALATRRPVYRSDELDADIVGLLAKLEGRFVIGAFGHINRLKRLPSVLNALARVREMGFDAVLLVVGEVNDPSIDRKAMIEEQGLADHIIATGSCSDMTFDACLERCDVVLNLRYPTLGESSGSLHRAFAFGKACLVSDVGQFAEHADDLTWKADVGEHEAEELVQMLTHLFKNPGAREQLSRNGLAYARNFCSFPQYAERLFTAVMENVK